MRGTEKEALDWPCGLMIADQSDHIVEINATMRHWLGLADEVPVGSLQLSNILPRAARIYLETHLRPLLIRQGSFSEVSLEFLCSDGTRFGAYVNAVTDTVDHQPMQIRFAILRNDVRQSFEQELVARRREGEVFTSLVRSSPHAITRVDDTLIIRSWNPAAEDLFGYTHEEAIGQRFDNLLIPSDLMEEVSVNLARVRAGDVLREETIRRHKSGQLIAVEKSIAATRSATDEFDGFVAIYSDITARKASEAQVQTLMREINHRSKNLLSVVQVIAQQTGRRHEGEEFRKLFSQRLASLAANQDSLIDGHRTDHDLGRLVSAQFAHLAQDDCLAFSMSGPALTLNEAAAQAIGMAIFELVTNAVKYGALSVETGTVSLTWSITKELNPLFEMIWQEQGGPDVSPPSGMGFGSRVTGPILESVVSGTVERTYRTEGLYWRLTAPVEGVSPKTT